MQRIDARRLTGPNLLMDRPCAVLDVACRPAEAAKIIDVWRSEVQALLTALSGWQDIEFAYRALSGGVSLAFSAPIDALYSATEINEWAWQRCLHKLNHDETRNESLDLSEAVPVFRAALAEEANIALIDMQAEAARRKVDFLWDDDAVSLGLGRTSAGWPARALPSSGDIAWTRFQGIPVGLITGTNGKTTTVRISAHILRQHFSGVGISSTDWIGVNGEVVDRGDWSGPGGARQVLRRNDVDVAVLECARGGMLRRGLGVAHANAALITNIAADHLGDFGSRNLDELLEAKWIVTRAVAEKGQLILNADDGRLVRKAKNYAGRLVWFGLRRNNRTIRAHVARGGTAYILDAGELVYLQGRQREVIVAAAEIPITINGAARHNIANSLAAAAMTTALGATRQQIRDGLISMSASLNPGRGKVFVVDGVTVVEDFAHNPKAIEAMLAMVRELPARRRVICFGQAGDRPEALIRELARKAWAIGLERVMLSELPAYNRGRDRGEVCAIIRDELLKQGADAAQIEYHEEELESLDAALDWAKSGDLVIMLALERAAALQERLRSLARTIHESSGLEGGQD